MALLGLEQSVSVRLTASLSCQRGQPSFGPRPCSAFYPAQRHLRAAMAKQKQGQSSQQPQGEVSGIVRSCGAFTVLLRGQSQRSGQAAGLQLTCLRALEADTGMSMRLGLACNDEISDESRSVDVQCHTVKLARDCARHHFLSSTGGGSVCHCVCLAGPHGCRLPTAGA